MTGADPVLGTSQTARTNAGIVGLAVPRRTLRAIGLVIVLAIGDPLVLDYGGANQEIRIDAEWPHVSQTVDVDAGPYGRTRRRADVRTSRYADPPDLIGISARSEV
jgi:hypothetical protein